MNYWIPIKDEKPAENQHVLTCNKAIPDSWLITRRIGDKFWLFNWEVKVTHWQPLPPIPKEHKS